MLIEPEFYAPILPMALINGAEGIGTGWSTFVPSFNPLDLAMNIKRKLMGDEMLVLVPWVKGF